MEDVLGPAHNAAFQGNDDGLRGLAYAVDAGRTHAFAFARMRLPGQCVCSRAFAIAVDANARTPAHIAAMKGHASSLHALHELGAAASLSAADAEGMTPAHFAAMHGNESCLHALHELSGRRRACRRRMQKERRPRMPLLWKAM